MKKEELINDYKENDFYKFVSFTLKVAIDKGINIDFTNNENLKSSGLGIKGKIINGYVTKDGIVLNVDSKKSLNSIVGHEITHILKGSDAYNELRQAIFDYANTKGEYESRLEDLKDLYKDVEGADINAELTADLVGDYLFTDEKFVNRLSTQNRNLFQKIYDEIKYLIKQAKAGTDENRQLEKVKKLFEEAYKVGNKALQADIQFSINNNFTTEFDNWNQKDISGRFVLGTTSKDLQSIGLEKRDIVIDKTKLLSIINKHSEMTLDLIKRIPQILENPTLILKSQTVDGRLVVFGKISDNNGKPIMVAMELNPKENKILETSKIYKVASAYGRQNVAYMQNWLDNPDNILFIDNKKNRTKKWLNGLGLQLPVPNNQISSNKDILSQNDSDVKYSLYEDVDTISK